MLTVSDDAVSVESELGAGRLRCPACAGVLRSWGWARRRRIRQGVGRFRRTVSHRPRRGRCTRCLSTHVLLPVGLAGRRADSAAVIAVAVEAKTVTGQGHRPIAVRLGRPASTVRGWLRAFTASAAAITEVFTALTHRHGGDAAGLWPAPAGSVSAAALSAVAAYARVLAGRFDIVTVPWQSAGLGTVGPFFFSGPFWTGGTQHELALMSLAGVGKGGDSPDGSAAGAVMA